MNSRGRKGGQFHNARRSGFRRYFLFSFLISVFIIVFLLFQGVTALYLLNRGLFPILRLLFIIFITLSLCGVIEGMGWSSVLARYVRPIMRIGGFSDPVAVAFTTGFLSGVAANTMLFAAYKDGKISSQELFLSNLLNTGLPSYFLHLPTTVAIIIPLVGRAGAIYLGITFVAALLRTFFVIGCGRLFMPLRDTVHQIGPTGTKNGLSDGQMPSTYSFKDRKALVLSIIKRHISLRFTRIISYTIPIYLGVIALQTAGLFDWLQGVVKGLLYSSAFPVEGLSVVIFSIAAEFTAGAAAAGAMLNSGILTVNETIFALLMGNVIATPFRAIRHQLPRYLGIFSPSLGLKLLFTGQALRVISVILAGVFYYAVF